MARAGMLSQAAVGYTCPAPDEVWPAPGHEESALVAASPVMRELLPQARRVAASKAPVLIGGESGTGKELLANLIHRHSPRARQRFVRVNCAALAESLIESELFGHEKGAFTGAEASRPGRFEQADRGTLLLDEVGELPVHLQAKLLRVLEEEEFERVGGGRTLRVDVRVIATTNRDLQREVELGRFRDDLYYRLNAVQFCLPPLRARRSDVIPLAEHFLALYRQEAAVPLDGFSRQALDLLTACDWPGNVRQLRNVVRRACLLAKGPLIQPEELPPLGAATAPATAGTASAGRTLADIERQVILDTLRQLKGNKTAAAVRLGVTPRTLLNKLKRYRQPGSPA